MDDVPGRYDVIEKSRDMPQVCWELDGTSLVNREGSSDARLQSLQEALVQLAQMKWSQGPEQQ